MGRRGKLIHAAMAADMRSPNVSVTPINVEPYPPTSLSNGVLPNHAHITTDSQHSSAYNGPPGGTPLTIINGDTLDSSSDTEVAQIDFHATSVNLRQKKKYNENDIPRPMSWEGELSDGEQEMCMDEDENSHVLNSLYFCKM